MMSQRKAVLHIGPYKTGSTTIQSFLDMNGDKLHSQGVHFAAAPGRPNNVGLAVSCLDDHRITGLIRRLNLQELEDRFQYIEALKDSLAKEMEELPAHINRVVFSNEHCSGLIMTREIERLKALLDPYFSEFEIVLYLRRQDSRIISDYTEKVKDGYTEEFDVLNYRPAEGLDFEEFLDRWASIFGAVAIKPRRFLPKHFPNEDLIDDFCEAIGVAVDAGFSRPEAKNTGLSSKAVMFLRAFNERVPAYIDGKKNSLRNRLLPLLMRGFSGNGISTEAEAARTLLARHKASNARVAERYLNKSEDLFDDDVSRYEDSAFEELTADDAIEIAAYLWNRQSAMIEALKAEVSALKLDIQNQQGAEKVNLAKARAQAARLLESDPNRDAYYPSLLDEFMKCYEELQRVRQREGAAANPEHQLFKQPAGPS